MRVYVRCRACNFNLFFNYIFLVGFVIVGYMHKFGDAESREGFLIT